MNHILGVTSAAWYPLDVDWTGIPVKTGIWRARNGIMIRDTCK